MNNKAVYIMDLNPVSFRVAFRCLVESGCY